MTTPATSTFARVLAELPPGKEQIVDDLCTPGTRILNPPVLKLFCRNFHCKKVMRFHPEQADPVDMLRNASPLPAEPCFRVLAYRCPNCKAATKTYSVRIEAKALPRAQVVKIGEYPRFSPPIGSKLIEMVGEDRSLLLAGVECESLGHGIGACAYYRRVVENQRNRIFDAILKVATELAYPQQLLDELHAAKREVQFKKANAAIRQALPESLLIRGQNPLTLLHTALSQNLHSDSDESCLEVATSIRLVLGELVDRVQATLTEQRELNDAVKTLAKRNAAKP